MLATTIGRGDVLVLGPPDSPIGRIFLEGGSRATVRIDLPRHIQVSRHRQPLTLSQRRAAAAAKEVARAS